MPPSCIQAAFAEQRERNPDALAVSCGTVRLSYRELDRRANRIAHRLLALGAGPEVPVGLLLAPSAEVAVAFLAVVKTGGCYVPLPAAAPPERLRRILAQVRAPVLLSDSGVPGRGPVAPAGIRAVDAGADPPDVPDTDPDVPTPQDRAACVLFTSGSAGRPKGVAVTHRGVLSFALDPCWARGRHERVLSVAPHAYGVSAYEFWVPLLNGHRTVVAPPGPRDVALLRRSIEEEGISAVHLTAGLFRVVAEQAPEVFAPVAEVLTGGDVVAPAAVRRVLDACPGTVVRTLYGATETTAFATMGTFSEPPASGATVPVGRPLDDVRCHVLDAALRPVEPGAEGELYIAGARLARGYFGDPAETAARFVADPFGGPGDRMFRTGDLFRAGRDGTLEFRGRLDDQVKVRGHRVEPGEVERVLEDRPDVAHAAVVARGPEPQNPRLVAYVVPGPAGTDVAALREHAASMLPEHAVPAAFVTIDALPLTPNGKLDRAALPDVPPVREPAGRPPRTPRQRALCALFGEVLGVPGVGLDDSFFDLDGQSLAAVSLVGRIAGELGIELTVAELFDAPTVAGLDAWIAEGGRGR
ncbi:amino acid adenylation domain-containing protein [Actinomadura nitritigenes]|uniref:amino acid adenylation domain-containing protein n=1 Tax=Actinomadura nitritigenes TaxID=134602 RepID=UPI003D917350